MICVQPSGIYSWLHILTFPQVALLFALAFMAGAVLTLVLVTSRGRK